MWHPTISDPESAGPYTLRVYSAEKAFEGEGWRQVRVTLTPSNPDFDPLVLTEEDEANVRAVAEVVAVLPHING